jgi:hypothetical protein
MIIEEIFFIWAIWYFYSYGLPPQFNHFFVKIYFILEKLLYFDYWETYSDTDSESLPELHDEIEEYKPPPKYEDKYLEDIRKLDKEWVFTEEEHNEFSKLFL